MTPRHRKKLPGLWLMTDERVAPDLLVKAARRLPKGRAGIVFRHYRTAAPARRHLFDTLRAIARRRRLVLMLAGTARQAMAWRADGWHGHGAGHACRLLLRSAPVHNAPQLHRAVAAGADFVFLSPLFPTLSHPDGPTLGRVRFAALAHQAGVPVMALGGVGGNHRPMLRRLGAAGWAAIDGLTGQS
ncbi:thiamine-phosphate pyrophosphorylase [Sphingobium sp. OAS761]|uniref:thiamine phosphate synthase n=1 Tax=Sphingobium sp. OAS761 TaxID=2817901 RepID=UPI00209DEFB5|nr:thiamine phosphate synthase [Sphingobium sp. OAS761]MCP1470117.1 thiamine-phosphate pyrophosphorylase [Sphingobium sp. OAS761]